jgi:hypothetical protein
VGLRRVVLCADEAVRIDWKWIMKQLQLMLAVSTITVCAVGIAQDWPYPLVGFFAAIVTAYIQGRWGN